MWAHTLLVAAMMLSVVSSKRVTLSEQSSPTQIRTSDELSTSSLQYVFAFFRHGIRAPLYEPYPKDPNKQQFHKQFEKLGALTKAGKQEMYAVGQKLSEIYGNFVRGFSEESVKASSTETSRTIMSALSVMAGFFPPKKLFLPNLRWQPIPIWSDTHEFDKVYFYNDKDFPKLALEECPRYGKMIEKGYALVKGKDSLKKREKIYKLLQENTGLQDVNSINAGYEIYDILEFEKLNGLELPTWATMPRPEMENKPLYPDLMRPIMVDWFYTCQWLHRDKLMLLFYSGPLFNSIYNHLNGKKENKSKELFRYHNTHDDTILTLRWALGFDDPEFEVEAGDGIAFELHKQSEEYFVQVVYYHSLRHKTQTQFREVLQLPACPFPCKFDTFFKLYERWTPDQWEENCKIPSTP